MTVINLTPHPVHVYEESNFIELEQVNPTTWLADGVAESPLAVYESQGMARISTRTEGVKSSVLPGDVVATSYGQATGIPDGLVGSEVLIVSLPMQSMAKQAGLNEAGQMVAPYKVVRLRQDTSKVLGCMGFTY